MARKYFLKSGLIYAIQPFLERGVAVLLIPIYTSYLTPSSFGEWQFFYSLSFFLLPIMNAGIDAACWHFWGNPEKYTERTIFINACIAKSATGLIVLIGVVMPTLLAIEWKLSLEFFLYITSAFLLSYFQIFQQYLRARNFAGSYLTLALSYAAILGSLNIIGVTILRLDFKGILFGNVTANIIAFAGALIFANNYRAVTDRFDIKLIRSLIKYGFPLIFGSIGYVFISQSDKFFLKILSTENDLGLYSFGSQFASLITALIITPIFSWWNPILRWEIYRRKDGGEVFSRLNRIIVVILPLVTLIMIGGVVFVGKHLVSNDAYLEGFSVTPLLGFGQAFFALYSFNTIGLLFQNRTKTIAAIVVASALTNIGLNFLLVPSLAMYGAALASFLSFFLMYVSSSFFSQRTYPIQRDRLLEPAMTILSTLVALGVTYSIIRGWVLPQNIDIIFLTPGLFLVILIAAIYRKILASFIHLSFNRML